MASYPYRKNKMYIKPLPEAPAAKALPADVPEYEDGEVHKINGAKAPDSLPLSTK